MILAEAFLRPVKLYPDKLAVVDGGTRRSFRELDERVNLLANALLSLGIEKGQRVGILLKNCGEYLEIIGAGAKTGIVTVPINFRLASGELKFVIQDAACEAIILDSDYADIVASIGDELPELKHCICIGQAGDGMQNYDELLAGATAELSTMSVSESDLAIILYTSGTTGFPKGAMASQRIAGERCLISAIEMGISPDDRFLNVLPLFHISVQVALSFLHMGATNFIMRDWDARTFCELVEAERITAMSVAPTIVHFAVNYPDVSGYDLSSFRIIQYGGSPMPEATLKAGLELFNCEFIQALGSTENYTSVVLKPQDHKLEGTEAEVRRLTAAGRQAVMVEARVVDEDGRDVAPGEAGEVITRGAANFLGYWNNPEESASKLRNGWYYTGDIGTVDEEGYIFLLDRKNDMIISGGENIYPKEIENILYSHPAINEAAVLGVPDDDWGESVKALVILHEGRTATEQEIIEYCRNNLASYKKPRSVEFVEELPRNASGKVLKKELRKKYWGDR